MVDTISKINRINSVLTTENEFDKTILNQYVDYYEKVKFHNDKLMEGYFFNMNDDFQNNQDYFEDLLTFNIPSDKIHTAHLSENYTQKFTKLVGFVIEIKEDFFISKLFEKDQSGTFEIGEFDFSDVDKDDMSLLNIGSVFYWTFGHFVQNGQVKKMSEIRFQRIAGYDMQEFDEITDESNKLNQSINWE